MEADPWIRGQVDKIAIEQGCSFDAEAANFAIDFIETFCKLTKGKSKQVKLIPWQRDFVSRLFGWKRANGKRRFKSAYIEIPKKNGKSWLMSAIALYMAIADGENSAEIYLAAVNSKQARIIFDECVKILRSSSTFAKRIREGKIKINENLKKIVFTSTYSKIECATLDADAQDGLDSFCTIFDELHRQKSPKLWEIFQYAGKARQEPLLLAITTAGSDLASVCGQEHSRALKIINGESKDTSHLAIVYAANPKDDIDDPNTWRKANPSIGYTLSEEDFRLDLEKVRESPSLLNNFLRLRLNLWTSSTTGYIDTVHWSKAENNQPIDLEALKLQPCVGGVDLSSKLDITSLVLLFGTEATGFTVLPFFWLPEAQALEREKRDGIPYRQWAKEGLITLTKKPTIDYDFVEAQIRFLAKTYRIRSLTSDDWGSSEAVLQRLKSVVRVHYMRQGFRSMSEPTKELERLAIEGKLNHGGNKILEWMNTNAIVVSDPAGNLKLEKPHKNSPKKIDGLIALVECMDGVLRNSKPNVYSTRGIDKI